MRGVSLEDILSTLHKPENNTPERIRLISEVQCIELKCWRKSNNSSIRSPRITFQRQNVSINHVSPLLPSILRQRRKTKRATGTPNLGTAGKELRSDQQLPPKTNTPPAQGEAPSMEEGDSSSDDSSVQTKITLKVASGGS
ncbi:hypothetical protein TNCV_4021901 [Trichonephila clavipes]|nr:hypothetical protein TNCV_4021901 [Trichonephila clavipes]